MHAHNTFPLWSPSIFSAAREEGVPTVLTVHNYRLVCPSADLYRDSHPCEDCLGRPIAWPSVLHSCYRESRLQTGTVAAMLAVNRARGTWHRDVDAFIALTEFARSRLAQGGLPARRIHVKPNFIDPDPGPSSHPRSGLLFAGRLTEEKGVRTLVQALRTAELAHIDVRIAGSGPLEAELRAAAATMPNVHVLGRVSRAQILELMGRSIALVVPSEWYEGFPVTVAEAFATATPVIASRLGSLAEIVSDETGVMFEPGDAGSLRAALTWAVDNAAVMAERGQSARRAFDESYAADANLSLLLSIYGRARQSLAQSAGP